MKHELLITRKYAKKKVILSCYNSNFAWYFLDWFRDEHYRVWELNHVGVVEDECSFAEIQREEKEKGKKNNKKTDQNPTRPLVLLLYFHFRSHKIPDTAAVSFVFNHSLQTMFDITDFFTSFAEECTAFVLEQSAIFNAQHPSSACVCVCAETQAWGNPAKKKHNSLYCPVCIYSPIKQTLWFIPKGDPIKNTFCV